MKFDFDFQMAAHEIIEEMTKQIPDVLHEVKNSKEYSENSDEALMLSALNTSATFAIQLLAKYHEELNKFLEKEK